MLSEGWPDFVEAMTENIESISREIDFLHAKKTLSQEDLAKRTLLMDRKETYEKIRGTAQSAADMRSSLEDQIAEQAAKVRAYRERF
jgi:hypothetical protein